MSSDTTIHDRITSLVDLERTLRDERSAQNISRDAEQTQLADVEAELDQCWDLLRQRQALRDAGINADAAEVRSKKVVEAYLS